MLQFLCLQMCVYGGGVVPQGGMGDRHLVTIPQGVVGDRLPWGGERHGGVRVLPRATGTSYCHELLALPTATSYWHFLLPRATGTSYCHELLALPTATSYWHFLLPRATGTSYCHELLA